MLTQGTITCPMCDSKVASLKFLKSFDGLYFHICKVCSAIQKNEDDYLAIGYYTGYQAALEAAKLKIEEINNEDIQRV